MVDEYGNQVASRLEDVINAPCGNQRGGIPVVEDYGFVLLKHPESGYFRQIENKYGVAVGREFVDICLSHCYTAEQLERYYRAMMDQGEVEAKKYIRSCKMQRSKQSLGR